MLASRERAIFHQNFLHFFPFPLTSFFQKHALGLPNWIHCVWYFSIVLTLGTDCWRKYCHAQEVILNSSPTKCVFILDFMQTDVKSLSGFYLSSTHGFVLCHLSLEALAHVLGEYLPCPSPPFPRSLSLMCCCDYP